MAEPARHLRSIPAGVDPTTGEITHEAQCPGCLERDAEIAKLTTEARSWHRKFIAAKADKEAEAESHELWGQAIALWWEYKIATWKLRARWSADRFWLCEPFLRKDGFLACRYAVWGIAAHPNKKEITKDYAEVYNDFELAFKGRAQFERYAMRGWALFGKDLPQPSFLDDEQSLTSSVTGKR